MEMSENTERKLTPNDPVEPDTLRQFEEFQSNRAQIGERLLELEMTKVRLLRAAMDIDTQRQHLFEKILTDRGIDGKAPVEIEAKTGAISFLGPNGQPMPSPPAEAPAEPDEG